MTERYKRLSVAGFVAALLILVALTASAQESADPPRGEAQRESWQKVDEIFRAMGVKPGAAVADIGAGSGFFTRRLSTAVGAQGRVHAVEVGAEPLKRLRARVDSEKLSNVRIIEAAVDDPKLPAGSLDAALIVNAYHEMTAHQAMMTRIRAALKPGGRLVIVEPISPARRGSTRAEQTQSHEIDARFVRKEARDAGFHGIELVDPFTVRHGGQDQEWMLVLSPPASDWQDPSLRITPEEFEQAQRKHGVLLLDVRGEASFRRGHMPGAVMMTDKELDQIAKGNVGNLKSEKRLIVTYCS
jgi:predicted methyltransferase